MHFSTVIRGSQQLAPTLLLLFFNLSLSVSSPDSAAVAAAAFCSFCFLSDGIGETTATLEGVGGLLPSSSSGFFVSVFGGVVFGLCERRLLFRNEGRETESHEIPDYLLLLSLGRGQS